MEKTLLEKRIYERAKEKTEKEYKNFMNFLKSNKFGKNLAIRISAGDTINDERYIPLSDFGCNFALFNDDCLKSHYLDNSNLEKVYNDILEENIRIETDELLNKLDEINYLFNQ